MFFETDRNLRAALADPHARANLLQAGALLVAAVGLFAVASLPEIGALAIVLAILIAVGIVTLARRVPPRLVMRLIGARAHEAGTFGEVDALVAELSHRAALSRPPTLYVVPSIMLSAFSVGSLDRSGIAVTEGLLRRLTMREIAAVLAHEISHVCMGDLLVLDIADLVTRFAQVLYYLGLGLAGLNVFRLLTGEELVSWLTVVLFVLAPALLNLLQLGLARTREFTADRAAALLTGDPLGLASAVSRLEASPGSVLDDLVPPVPARRVPLPSLLRYPPPAAQRIARLQALNIPPMPPLDVAEGPRISLVGVGPIEMRPRYRWPGIWL